VKIAALVCATLGHRWRTVDSDESFAVMQCSRCGRSQGLSDELVVLPGLIERRERQANACAEIGTGLPRRSAR
jgi:hypothetical protein